MQYDPQTGEVIMRLRLSSQEFYALNLIEAHQATTVETHVVECLRKLIENFRNPYEAKRVTPGSNTSQ